MKKVTIHFKGHQLSEEFPLGLKSLKIDNVDEDKIPKIIDVIHEKFPNDIITYTIKNHNFWYKHKRSIISSLIVVAWLVSILIVAWLASFIYFGYLLSP